MSAAKIPYPAFATAAEPNCSHVPIGKVAMDVTNRACDRAHELASHADALVDRLVGPEKTGCDGAPAPVGPSQSIFDSIADTGHSTIRALDRLERALTRLASEIN